MRPLSATRDDREQAGVRYLLGLLPEEDHARVERRLLEDEEAFAQMSALEDELFHDYAQGGLEPSERLRFEERYLASDEGRRRVADARALLARLRRPAPPRTNPLLPLAAVLVLGAGTWFLTRRPVPHVAPAPAPSAPAPSAKVALALSPGVVRDVTAAAKRVRLRPDETLALTLELPATAVPPRLRARVLSADGREVWRSGTLVPSAPAGRAAVVLDVPPGALPEGDYQLLLAADAGEATEVADYAFTVLRR